MTILTRSTALVQTIEGEGFKLYMSTSVYRFWGVLVCVKIIFVEEKILEKNRHNLPLISLGFPISC